jgi:sec-independent protein translocase protein TatC
MRVAPVNSPLSDVANSEVATARHSPSSTAEMPLLEHLKELRTRLLYSLLGIFVGMALSFTYSHPLFEIVTRPYFLFFPPESLIGTGPAEAFVLRLKLAFFAGVFLTSPFLFYQVWLFVAPGLYDKEKKLVIPFVGVSTFLFSAGGYLCYEYLLPLCFSFFKSQYQIVGVTPQIRVSEHLSLTLRLIIASGILFELPLLTFFLARFDFLTHHTLIKGFRYAVVGCFIVSAVVTPTGDMLTQTLFAMPLLGLYMVSIGVAWIGTRRKKTPSP